MPCHLQPIEESSHWGTGISQKKSLGAGEHWAERQQENRSDRSGGWQKSPCLLFTESPVHQLQFPLLPSKFQAPISNCLVKISTQVSDWLFKCHGAETAQLIKN